MERIECPVCYEMIDVDITEDFIDCPECGMELSIDNGNLTEVEEEEDEMSDDSE